MNHRPFTHGNLGCLEACHSLEYLLLGDLRQLLEEPPSAQTPDSLLVILDRLLITLPRQLELQSLSGYMSDVLMARPDWSGRVNSLHSQDWSCFSALRALREQVVVQAPLGEAADLCRAELHRWMKLLVAHRHQENALTQAAFNCDDGGEA